MGDWKGVYLQYKYILLKKQNHIATMIFNQPERLNVLGKIVDAEIADALQDIAHDSDMRVLVITGAGRAFCTGGDFKSGNPASIAADPDRRPIKLAQMVREYTHGITLSLYNMEIPTIAMVNGPAAGAGFDIALACDIRIGCENSRFKVAWTARGLTTAFGTTWLLPRIICKGIAAELIFTARMVEAQEALQLHILNRLVSSKDLEQETMILAEQMAKGPPLALRQSKLNLIKGFEIDLDTALDLLASSQAQLLMTDDFGEAAKAFQEKREAVFKGQ
jgi:2-(1,2-epoxy-1,2-dihydrophenyl)acetyl-CoA isomerase